MAGTLMADSQRRVTRLSKRMGWGQQPFRWGADRRLGGCRVQAGPLVPTEGCRRRDASERSRRPTFGPGKRSDLGTPEDLAVWLN